MCEEIFKECNAANVGDAAAQNLCAKNEAANCGHLTPPNITESSTTTSSAASTPTSAAASGASASSTSSSKAAGATMAPMQQFGTGAMAVGIAAAFGYML